MYNAKKSRKHWSTIAYEIFVSEMRFELTQHFCHYPLKVACLPIPPPGHGLRNAGGF